ncbi:MAG TPA: hypothetical protein VNF49_03225 [Candidatus Binataceae bacterium]|nr:hypothetical protein [Candidatus Binataceae bacterium]
MMDSTIDGYSAVKRFIRDHPDWTQIVMACLIEADSTRDSPGEFAGAWVLQKAKDRGVAWFPNLRPLVTYEILKRTGGSRGGRRAYYMMPDPEGVKRALAEIGVA